MLVKTKGAKTKEHILGIALDMASTKGFDRISLADVAEAAELSRSGLFAHFKSKEQMQLDILKYAEDLFIQTVIAPASKEANPLKKLELLQKHWPGWEERAEPVIRGGCPFLVASFEFDDQPGPVRDYVLLQEKRLVEYIAKCFSEAQSLKYFSKKFDKDEFAFEFYSFYMGYQQYKKFLSDQKAKNKFIQSIDALFARASD